MKNPLAHAGSFARTVRPEARRSGLADVIVDQSVRSMYGRLVGCLESLHGSVRVTESGIELRAEFENRILCRVVPYRELLHIQVGTDPTWEVRVRDRTGYVGAVDRILREFLRLSRPAPDGPPAPEK